MNRVITLTSAVIIICLILSVQALAEQPSVEAARQAITKAMPEWSIKSYLNDPTFSLDDVQGYRMLLCKENKVIGPINAQLVESIDRKPEYVTTYEFIELILFPTPNKLRDGITDLLPWNGYKHEYYIKAVDIGQGLGFRWFANTTLYSQHILRTALKLKGGDDPIKLQIEALGVKDKGEMTRHSAVMCFESFGDQATPYIEKAIAVDTSDKVWFLMQGLGRIRTPGANAYLKKLYWSSNKKLSYAAGYALAHQPYREDRKKEYIDFLKKHTYVTSAAAACAEFKIHEALPALKQVMAKPMYWHEYHSAFQATRIIQGNPIPKEITEAAHAVAGHWSLKSDQTPEVDSALALLVGHKDVEAVAVEALDLMLKPSKGTSEFFERNRVAAVTIFKGLPAKTTAPILASLGNLGRQMNDNLTPLLGSYDAPTQSSGVYPVTLPN